MLILTEPQTKKIFIFCLNAYKIQQKSHLPGVCFVAHKDQQFGTDQFLQPPWIHRLRENSQCFPSVHNIIKQVYYAMSI